MNRPVRTWLSTRASRTSLTSAAGTAESGPAGGGGPGSAWTRARTPRGSCTTCHVAVSELPVPPGGTFGDVAAQAGQAAVQGQEAPLAEKGGQFLHALLRRVVDHGHQQPRMIQATGRPCRKLGFAGLRSTWRDDRRLRVEQPPGDRATHDTAGPKHQDSPPGQSRHACAGGHGIRCASPAEFTPTITWVGPLGPGISVSLWLLLPTSAGCRARVPEGLPSLQGIRGHTRAHAHAHTRARRISRPGVTLQ